MVYINHSDRWFESAEIIEKFLIDMREPLINDRFILQKRNDDANTQTLLDLNFDRSDIIQELLGLKLEEYIYTTRDKKFPEENPYNVFHKDIKSKEIYIKIKIKEKNNKILYCMSFHEAKHKESNYPFK